MYFSEISSDKFNTDLMYGTAEASETGEVTTLLERCSPFKFKQSTSHRKAGPLVNSSTKKVKCSNVSPPFDEVSNFLSNHFFSRVVLNFKSLIK